MKSLQLIPTTVATIVLLFMGTNISAKEENISVFDQATKVMEMETRHENEWKNFMSKNKTRKFELMTKHNNERLELKKKKLNDMKENGFSEELLLKYTQECLKLHKKHHEEWRTMCEEKYKAKMELADKQMEEINTAYKMLAIE